MMKRISVLLFCLCGAAFLSGCINLPQTKALVTPVGAVGVHNFAPPNKQPRDINLDRPDQRLVDAQQPE
jgi:hypothetical protein